MDGDRTQVLDQSAFTPGAARGAEVEVANSGFGLASFAVLGPNVRVAAHAHEIPYLSIYLLGGYREYSDDQDVLIDAPAAAFHPAGAAHEDQIGRAGLRTLVVQFDPTWLNRNAGGSLPDRSTYWTAGPAAAEAREFAQRALRGAEGRLLIEHAAGWIAKWSSLVAAKRPAWLTRLDRVLTDDPGLAPPVLAERLGLSLPWMLRAYRALRGEGLGDRLRRRALEMALAPIESGHATLSEIAVESGFYDQSHLTRVCRKALGLTPGQLRQNAERRTRDHQFQPEPAS